MARSFRKLASLRHPGPRGRRARWLPRVEDMETLCLLSTLPVTPADVSAGSPPAAVEPATTAPNVHFGVSEIDPTGLSGTLGAVAWAYDPATRALTVTGTDVRDTITLSSDGAHHY